LEAENALYQFYITNQSQTLLSVTPCAKVVPQEVPYTLTFQLGGVYESPFSNLDNLTNMNSTLKFNKTSNSITFTYTDTSGTFNLSEMFTNCNNLSTIQTKSVPLGNMSKPVAVPVSNTPIYYTF
jgi:hypothetical protein